MKRIIIIIGIIFLCVISNAQNKSYEVYSIAFYNLENLFDTEDDPNNTGDDEYLKSSACKWTQEKYEKKLDNLAKVIAQLGRKHCPLGPVAIGVSEVENRKVLEDLVKRPAIVEMGLKIIHKDSPDWRGIDVALLYNPELFTITGYKTYKFISEDKNFKTREQLLVSGLVSNEPVHLVVNHWPSRYGAKSSFLREIAASINNKIIDSLYTVNADAKVILMGDLNDDPVDKSCRKVLNAKKNKRDVKGKSLYNPMWKLYSEGIGSLGYQGKWSLFDQIIFTPAWIKNNYSSLQYWKVEVFNRDFLIQKEGKHKGYPFRTFSNNTFVNGYSDHFPVITYIIKEK